MRRRCQAAGAIYALSTRPESPTGLTNRLWRLQLNNVICVPGPRPSPHAQRHLASQVRSSCSDVVPDTCSSSRFQQRDHVSDTQSCKQCTSYQFHVWTLCPCTGAIDAGTRRQLLAGASVFLLSTVAGRALADDENKVPLPGAGPLVQASGWGHGYSYSCLASSGTPVASVWAAGRHTPSAAPRS